MEESNLLAYLIGGGTLGGALTVTLKELWQLRKGRHKEERQDRAEQLVDLRTKTEQVRLLREHAVDVRNYCMRHHGTPSTDLPRWPGCPTD